MICRFSKLLVSVLILPIGLCFCACNGCEGDDDDGDGGTDTSAADCTVEETEIFANRFCGLSENSIFALSSGLLNKFDGSTWSQVEVGGQEAAMKGIWCSSEADIFIVGFKGDGQIESLIRHYDGQTWTDMEHPGPYERIIAIWGASPNDVFAIAIEPNNHHEAIIHYNGSEWTEMVPAASMGCDRIWGTSGTDVYAFGGGGIIHHYNGEVWSVIILPSSAEIKIVIDVWGTGPNNLYFVGGTGDEVTGEESFPVIVHYDGSGWTPTVIDWWWDIQWSEPPNERFNAIWGCGDGSIFAVGTKSYYYNGADWREIMDSAMGLDVWGASAEETWVASGFMYKVSCQ